MKKIVCTILILALAFTAFGCDTAGTSSAVSLNTSPNNSSDTAEAVTYCKATIDIPFGLGHISKSLFTEDNLYFIARTYTYNNGTNFNDGFCETDERLVKMELSGKATALQNFDYTVGRNCSALFEDKYGNLYAVKTVWSDDSATILENSLLKLGSDGAVVKQTALTKEISSAITVDSDGYIYMAGRTGITAYNPDFEKLFSVNFSSNRYVYELFPLRDGRIACVIDSSDDLEIQIIDRKKASVDESFIIENADFAYKGNSKYDMLCLSHSENMIFALNIGEEPAKLVSLDDYALGEIGITNIALTEAGDIIVVGDTGRSQSVNGELVRAETSDVILLRKR